MLDFEGNSKREEAKRQLERMLRAPQVVGDREHPFSEHLLVDSSGSADVSAPVLAKVSVLVEALRSSVSYELLHHLWSHFTLIAEQVNVHVMWLQSEVLLNVFSVFLLP